MSFTVLLSEPYVKRAKKFFKQHQNLIPIYEKTLLLLQHNPFHPSLRLHKLRGPLKHFHSISISLRYRITLELFIADDTIVLIDIGSRDQVY